MWYVVFYCKPWIMCLLFYSHSRCRFLVLDKVAQAFNTDLVESFGNATQLLSALLGTIHLATVRWTFKIRNYVASSMLHVRIYRIFVVYSGGNALFIYKVSSQRTFACACILAMLNLTTCMCVSDTTRYYLLDSGNKNHISAHSHRLHWFISTFVLWRKFQ